MFFFVDCHGLSVIDAPVAIVSIDAPHALDVTSGQVLCSLWLDRSERWGLLDRGVYPPDEIELTLFEEAHGAPPEQLLTRWRATIANEGFGITLNAQAPIRVEARTLGTNASKLVIRWAGLADYNVDGVVDVSDSLDFMTAWFSGWADFNCDGSVDGLDIAAFMQVFEAAEQG